MSNKYVHGKYTWSGKLHIVSNKKARIKGAVRCKCGAEIEHPSFVNKLSTTTVRICRNCFSRQTAAQEAIAADLLKACNVFLEDIDESEKTGYLLTLYNASEAILAPYDMSLIDQIRMFVEAASD